MSWYRFRARLLLSRLSPDASLSNKALAAKCDRYFPMILTLAATDRWRRKGLTAIRLALTVNRERATRDAARVAVGALATDVVLAASLIVELLEVSPQIGDEVATEEVARVAVDALSSNMVVASELIAHLLEANPQLGGEVIGSAIGRIVSTQDISCRGVETLVRASPLFASTEIMSALRSQLKWPSKASDAVRAIKTLLNANGALANEEVVLSLLRSERLARWDETNRKSLVQTLGVCFSSNPGAATEAVVLAICAEWKTAEQWAGLEDARAASEAVPVDSLVVDAEKVRRQFGATEQEAMTAAVLAAGIRSLTRRVAVPPAMSVLEALTLCLHSNPDAATEPVKSAIAGFTHSPSKTVAAAAREALDAAERSQRLLPRDPPAYPERPVRSSDTKGPQASAKVDDEYRDLMKWLEGR